MNRIIAVFIVSWLFAISANAKSGKSDDFIAKMTRAQEFCYATSVMASVSVNLRNEGQSLEQQLSRKRESLSEGEFKLIESILNQIYDKKLTDSLAVASDTNQACLDIQGFRRYYYPSAIKTCPRVGIMVSEVTALKAAGKTNEDIITLVGERFKDVKTTAGKSVSDVSMEYTSMDTGLLDYKMCMILGMAQQK